MLETARVRDGYLVAEGVEGVVGGTIAARDKGFDRLNAAVGCVVDVVSRPAQRIDAADHVAVGVVDDCPRSVATFVNLLTYLDAIFGVSKRSKARRCDRSNVLAIEWRSVFFRGDASMTIDVDCNSKRSSSHQA